MRLFKFFAINLLLLFQCIQCKEPTLLNKEHYYAKCLKELSAPALNDYNELLAKVEDGLDAKVSHTSLEQSIIDFAQALLNRSISLEELSCFNGDPGKGLSGNPIFKVGRAPQSTLVVKAFKGGNGEFSKEFLNLNTYNQNKLQDLQFPQVYGIGVTTVGKEKYFLIGMQFIEGCTINDLFIKLFHQEKNSKERNRLLSLLQKVYTKVGKGLAQFHYQKVEADQSIPAIHLQSVEKLLNAAVAFLSSRAEGVTLAKEIQSAAKSTKWLEVLSQHYDLGYMHTDVHPGNFIVNLETEELYLIDIGGETIGSNGMPIGMPFLDLAQVYNQLNLRKIWEMSDKEVDSLYSSFVQGYKSETSRFPTHEQMAFCQLVDMLNFFGWYGQINDKLDDKSKKILTDIYECRLESCLSLLKDFKGQAHGP